MLSDVLGVLIAFISIILLLSIVVTALTQATQATFRVRGRNLLTSVTRLLEATNHLDAGLSRTEKRKAAARSPQQRQCRHRRQGEKAGRHFAARDSRAEDQLGGGTGTRRGHQAHGFTDLERRHHG